MLAQNMTYMRKREAEKKATRRAMAKAEVKSSLFHPGATAMYDIGQETADGGDDDGR